MEAVLLGIERRFKQTMVIYKDAAGRLGYSYPALVRSPWPDPDWVSAVDLLGSRHPIAGLARVGLVAVDPAARLAAITPAGLAALAYRDLPPDLRLVLARVGGRATRVAAIAAEASLDLDETEARLARLDELGLVEQPNLGYWRAGPALELRCRRCLALPSRPAGSSCGPCGQAIQEEATGRRAEARKDGAPCLGCGQPKDGRKALFCADCRDRLAAAERARYKAMTAGRQVRRLALQKKPGSCGRDDSAPPRRRHPGPRRLRAGPDHRRLLCPETHRGGPGASRPGVGHRQVRLPAVRRDHTSWTAGGAVVNVRRCAHCGDGLPAHHKYVYCWDGLEEFTQRQREIEEDPFVTASRTATSRTHATKST
ncbi:MAG: hypothetical protein E6Q97_24445 [Desulfurellales bacterium]|nr:MAG: hypothetical protein E6Q97_24445 [Desulfurellales bacterium]